jgi:hypothetical protein
VTAQLMQSADFDTSRFCPFHGDFVRLADAPIVATNDMLAPVTNSAALGPAPGRQADETLTSAFDNKARVKLAGPPARPVVPVRRFSRPAPPPLPSALESAGGRGGGAAARPARACPVCFHPLPAGIDARDPVCVSLVGHPTASKTTTMVALAEVIRHLGPEAIGLREFMATEETANRLRRQVMGGYRRSGSVVGTDGQVVHAPMEFFATPGRFGQPVNLLLHDVAGEQLIQSGGRTRWAPAVLWSDVILFFYNPEEAPALDLKTGEIDQAVLLNGVHDDLAEYTRLRNRDGSPRIPPLIVLLCKADLVPSYGRDFDPADENQVRRALRELGDGDVVAAGNRWPQAYWRAVSAQPTHGGPARGVTEVFGLVTHLLREQQ